MKVPVKGDFTKEDLKVIESIASEFYGVISDKQKDCVILEFKNKNYANQFCEIFFDEK